MMSRRYLIGSSLAIAGASSIAEAAGPAPATVATRFAFEAHVTVDAPLVVGPSTLGLRRIAPITGGTVSGPRLQGRVVPGGADWQFVRSDGVLVVEAKYTLESSDGVLIMVTNRGMRHGPTAVIERMARGEAVDPQDYYFRTSAEFEAPVASAYAWLNRAIFIGVAERTAKAAIIRFHEVT